MSPKKQCKYIGVVKAPLETYDTLSMNNVPNNISEHFII